ncbi:transglycosylase-like protein with SLT domain [Salsuginibacillus halophilus]|uniref:Transglycosylase-like protein with SLT domain n=1 Tax=Salsuginibacillus halophilus TaxID=517424 RepID=A0A2P8HXH2_9BACI|nr:lytic transglycosylase domain-containing protein [Salsuginibacillus halophilus]PSL50908.1 transglycosylase-like protein with SLT domain [Salsuginibacillus halophilus]
MPFFDQASWMMPPAPSQSLLSMSQLSQSDSNQGLHPSQMFSQLLQQSLAGMQSQTNDSSHTAFSLSQLQTSPHSNGIAEAEIKTNETGGADEISVHDKAPASINQIVSEAANRYNLSPGLIHAVIEHESSYNPDAKSHAGAMGLMQLMPGTARWLNVDDPYDPADNIDGGAKYLRDLLDQYDNDLEHALAAYNAGPGNVDKYGGIPPFAETTRYVPNVIASYESFA